MADLDKPVDLKERTTIRKGINALRREGMTPGVIHNHGGNSVHVVAATAELTKIFSSAGKHHPLELKVGSDKYLALIKDAQFNPVKRRLDHVVFQAINRNEKVHAEIPVHIEGDAPAEKLGLMILTQLDHVEVDALPRNLPDEFRVDAEMLAELNDAITVADIKVPDGVTILTEADHPIARVVETPAQASEETEAEGEEGEGDASAEGTSEEGAENETTSDKTAEKSN
jgi:large subunit ribosomal protein L25